MRLDAAINFSLLLILILVSGRASFASPKNDAHPPMAIASLSPGITETLYALGLGDKVAAATQFCDWPEDAKSKPKVAGFREVNLEALVRARPDLAVLPADMAYYKPLIENMGIPVILFDGASLDGFLRDVKKLGEICGAQEQAAKLIDSFKGGMAMAQALEKSEGKKPRILFAVMNPDECSRPIMEMNVIGNDGFYSKLIEAAGGVNAYSGKLNFPRLSREAIIALKPDIIVAAAPLYGDEKTIEKLWKDVNPAWTKEKNGFQPLMDPGDTIPGPRALGTLQKIRGVIERAAQSKGAR